jgi:hypothetical protein
MSETAPPFEQRTYRLREFRTVSIRDQADRDAIASRLMRPNDEGLDWADIIGMSTRCSPIWG